MLTRRKEPQNIEQGISNDEGRERGHEGTKTPRDAKGRKGL
jgi:hypothetical protein